MKSRLSRILALAALVITPLAVLTVNQPAANAAAADFCSVDPTAPCIEVATIGGADIPQNGIIVDTYADPTEALHNTGFTVLDLDSGDVGSLINVVMKTGDIKPRITSMTGDYVSADRFQILGVWYIDIEMYPVEMLESCDGDPELGEPLCPETADPGDVQVQAQGNINDAYWYSTDPVEADKLMGLDQFSNINLLWYPPTIAVSSTGVTQLIFEMENSHFYPDGTTVFKGRAQIRIPNNVLRDFYGIPNPDTMVAGSLVGTIGTGDVEAYEVESADAWQIDAFDITFSNRKLKTSRGVIVPTKPQGLFADRKTSSKAKITFAESQPRGAKVKGYQARCVSGGGHVVTALRIDPTPAVTVTGLKSNTKYTCKVRAKSKAGYGPYSAAVGVTRKPAQN